MANLIFLDRSPIHHPDLRPGNFQGIIRERVARRDRVKVFYCFLIFNMLKC